MRILLVDDDQLIRFVHQMYLEQSGHDVIGLAEDAQQAIDMALSLSPDLIVMDIRLENNSNGIDAMRKIQESAPIPAIYVSGNSDRKTVEDAEKTIMKAFLVKPISQEELKNALA